MKFRITSIYEPCVNCIGNDVHDDRPKEFQVKSIDSTKQIIVYRCTACGYEITKPIEINEDVT